MKPYKTLLRRASFEFTVNKSRFIGHAAPVRAEEDALEFLREIKDTYKDASHNCFAYIIGQNAGIQRYIDDGEPGGTAGLPIISVMAARGVVDAAVVVTRYFGGILLGAGGLARAYTKGAAAALDSARVAVMHPTDTYLVSLEYSLWDRLRHRLEAQPVDIVSVEFAADVLVTLRMKSADAEAVLAAIASATDGKAETMLVEEGYAPWEEDCPQDSNS